MHYISAAYKAEHLMSRSYYFCFVISRGGVLKLSFFFFAVTFLARLVVFRESDGYGWPWLGGFSLWSVLLSVLPRSGVVSAASGSVVSVVEWYQWHVTVYGSVRVRSECLRNTKRPRRGAIPRVGAAKRKSHLRTHPGSTWWIAHSLGNVLV